MTSHEIEKADLLDLIFEGRNKLYGAYALRRHYPQRLLLALCAALSLGFLLFLLQPGWRPSASLHEAAKKEVQLQQIIFPAEPPPPVPPPPVQPAPPPAATASFTPVFKLVQEVDPAQALQPVDQMENQILGSTNLEGPAATGHAQPPIAPTAQGGGDGAAARGETPFDPVEQQPEFPGGMQAWVAFLNRHLQTPDDLEAGEKRTVLVSFLVNAEGFVTGFKVVQSGGAEFDEEVIRVLRKMPRWKPAIQNGKAVVMPFTQPVTFVGVEQ